jgi:hypothetical protein
LSAVSEPVFKAFAFSQFPHQLVFVFGVGAEYELPVFHFQKHRAVRFRDDPAVVCQKKVSHFLDAA